MRNKNVQRIELIIVLVLAVMIINDFSLHLVETLKIETQHPFYDYFWGFESPEAHNDFWTIHWGVASILIIILAVLLLTDYMGMWSARSSGVL